MNKTVFCKTWTLWTIAIIITLSSVFYQRITGPTKPIRGTAEIAGEMVNYKLPRTHDTTDDAAISIEVSNPDITGGVRFKRFKSHDNWAVVPMTREGDLLKFDIPKQPSAGKVEYSVSLFDSNDKKYNLTEEPVIIRFKDPVPLYVLIPHASIMFLAMLFSTVAGVMAIAGHKSDYTLAILTVVGLFVGGLILGPVVQKFAFGAFWTGWPFGHDLTDNKTAVAFIFWIIALWRAKIEGKGRGWMIVASVVTLAIYLIPHSVLGSEIDYTKTI